MSNLDVANNVNFDGEEEYQPDVTENKLKDRVNSINRHNDEVIYSFTVKK